MTVPRRLSAGAFLAEGLTQSVMRFFCADNFRGLEPPRVDLNEGRSLTSGTGPARKRTLEQTGKNVAWCRAVDVLFFAVFYACRSWNMKN
jgi:hypothetical protein